MIIETYNGISYELKLGGSYYISNCLTVDFEKLEFHSLKSNLGIIKPVIIVPYSLSITIMSFVYASVVYRA